MRSEHRQPPLRGHTLSIPFTLGWMLACLDVFGGSGGVPTLFTIAFRDWFRETTAIPLYSYYRRVHLDTNLPLQPVDYWYLTRLCESISIGYGSRQVKKLTQRIGQAWWASTYSLLDRRHSSYTLQYVLGPAIIHGFHDTDTEPEAVAVYYSLTPQEKDQHLTLQACTILAQQLQERGAITCHLTTNATGIQLTFPICPFCDNDAPNCHIFYGVVQGMICWLWSGTNPATLTTLKDGSIVSTNDGSIKRVHINTIAGSHHQIQVSFPTI